MTPDRRPGSGRRLRHWMRGLEPRVMGMLDGPVLRRTRPWLDRHQLFSFQREPLARGVAIGALCGVVPGPLQVMATVALCAWWRGNAVAGTLATLYTNPLTIIPIYLLAFQVGSALLPGTQDLPPWPETTAGHAAWLSDLAQWMLALGWPLLVGLPVLGLLVASLGYLGVQALWLAPVYRRALRMRRNA